jgi:hypothetical protein
MSPTRDEILLRRSFAAVRRLEPTDAEVAAVLARAAGRPPAFARPAGRDRARFLVPALAALLLLLGASYAVPPTRAAIDAAAAGVSGIFDGWGSDGSAGTAPGRALGPDEAAPNYFREGAWSEAHVQDPRVIASAGGYELYAYRERNGSIGFDLGDTGVGMGGYSAADFDGRGICLLGPGSMRGPDEHGHIPYFGVSSPAVRSLELEYADGSTERSEVPSGGGFVLLTVPSRHPLAVTAFDAGGEELGRATIGESGSYC